ncbi:hypothetical protein IX56_18205, partial [Paracoccus sanguinis]
MRWLIVIGLILGAVLFGLGALERLGAPEPPPQPAGAKPDNCGARASRPVHIPSTAGPPARGVGAARVQSGGRIRSIGAAMPTPSATWCSAKRRTRNVPSPADPAAKAP